MYLSTLDLHGFKSFADATTLEFDPGVTAIVGPNGCGKSNIVDAVRWVIGEQRPTVLRSDTMQNVIFNGTANRRPVGMAEVELTIENTRGVLPTEYSEVTIGRRLFRDGASEYLLNGTQCRLKDITDLFMDTGMGADAYSVIELKMIDEILSGSTEDRRRMFEEAAGITRYKKRRKQALRKLESTRSDLERVHDLTDEIRSQVRRLEKQAQRAETYNEAAEALETHELHLAQARLNRLNEQQAAVAQQQTRQVKRIQALRQQEAEAEGRLAALRARVQEREAALQAHRETLQVHREQVRELEAEQRVQRERLNQARRDRDRAVQAREEAAAERERLVDTEERLAQTLEEARPAVEAANEALEAAREERDAAQAEAKTLRERVRRLRAQAQAAEREQTERRRTLDRLANRRDLQAEELKRTRSQADALTTDADALEKRVAEARSRYDAAQQALANARDNLEAADTERAARYDTLEAAKDALREAERERDAVRAEVDLLEGLVSSYDEFSDAVQFLATDGPFDTLQTVADVLACDDEIRLALDAALGDLAACILVETEAEARAAIAQLRAEDKGHACFVVRERLPERLASAAPPGGTPPDGTTALRTHVRTSGANAHLADVLLQHHFLASTLDAAQSAAADAPPFARIVTPAGEWVDARGLLNGGSQQEATSPVASRLGRQEQLEAARQQRDAAAATCQKRQEAVDAATAALQAIDLHPYREAVRSAEQTLRQAEKEWERVQYEQETLADRRDELQERRATLEAEQAALAERIDELRAEVQDVQDTVDRLQAQYADASTALDAAEDRERTAVEAYSDANVAAVEARNRLQNLERDHTRTQERIATIDRQQAQRAESIASLKATIEDALDTQTTLDERIDDLREDRQAYEDAVDAAADAVHDAKAEIADVESELRRLRDEREQAVRQENDAAVRRAEIETRIEDLVESTQDDIGRNLVDNPASLPDDFDATAVEENVRSLRGRINAIGSVNALALDEYASEKERLDFLEEQQADLAAAEEKVLETIQEINTTASERFFETFDAIQESFGILFTELFGEGASAELQLEDPGDPLDTAIEIVAQPRGKRPVTLSQLSSGEKTLTAIALLFAIYLVKPSPFCILDEVDAPLDDANVERFMHLVRRFEDDTQFILVTHNQRTMALADRLYGVTMEEQGISTLVGVAFDEAVEMAG